MLKKNIFQHNMLTTKKLLQARGINIFIPAKVGSHYCGQWLLFPDIAEENLKNSL